MFVYRLSEENLINDDNNFQKCCDIGFGTLNRHELCKKKMLSVIKCHFIIKKLSKAIIAQFRLHNGFLKNTSEEN